MKTYSRHNCKSAHRTAQTFLRCAVPRAAWVAGHGKFALIAWCGVPTITLHQAIEPALQQRAVVDSLGCGGRCRKRHEVVHVDVGGTA